MIGPVQMESPVMKMASQMAKIQVSFYVQSFFWSISLEMTDVEFLYIKEEYFVAYTVKSGKKLIYL